MALPYPEGMGVPQVDSCSLPMQLPHRMGAEVPISHSGYFVNTVGLNEDLIRRYVAYHEKCEKAEEHHRRDYYLFQS